MIKRGKNEKRSKRQQNHVSYVSSRLASFWQLFDRILAGVLLDGCIVI